MNTPRKKHRSKLVRDCTHPHPYGVSGNSLWCPICGAIMFSSRACPVYLRSDWTLPTHDPETTADHHAPVTVWHRDKTPYATLPHE
jgi:hypothetical protein